MNDLQNDDRGGTAPRKFRLDRSHAKLAGVCAGIADYFGIDTTMVRIVFVLGALFGVGSFVLIYLAIWLLAD